MKKHLSVSVIVMILLALAACQPTTENNPEPTPEPTEEPAGMPNPASVYCEEQGGQLELREDENGSYGVCIFDDGSECDEWAFYRGECRPGKDSEQPATESEPVDVGMANPAAEYCNEQGYQLEIRSNDSGAYGVCIFDDGSECDEWEYWRGECGPGSNEEQVNIALDAGLVQAVQLDILELDPAGESDDLYALLLTIDDELQLMDLVRALNTATPRTPKTLCIPSMQFRFTLADGQVVEFGGMCDANPYTVGGEQDFWQNQEAAAPIAFVALVNSHLGRSQVPLPGDALNVVALAELEDTQRIEVYLQSVNESDGVGVASAELAAEITDPAVMRTIVQSLNGEFALTPRARCLANVTLLFYHPDGSSYSLGYGCELADGVFFRGEGNAWQERDLLAPPGFRELLQSAIEMSPPAAKVGTDDGWRAVAWYGAVVSSEQGDRLVLQPEGVGELAVAGWEDEDQQQIDALRDQTEPGRYAHFWGVVQCEGESCTLTADRIRVDASGLMYPPETVDGWEGVIVSPGGDGAEYDDAFVLAGDWPLLYGIGSRDEDLASRIEALRDTDTLCSIWGELTAGLPDANGTQIVVTAIECSD